MADILQKSIFSAIRRAYKGFLLEFKATGGLSRAGAGPGSPKDAPPRVPRAPGAWFPAPKCQMSNVKKMSKMIKVSKINKKCLGIA